MSHTAQQPSPIEELVDSNTLQNSLPNSKHQIDISRRSALKALMAAAGATVLFGAMNPRSAFAASATKETLDALATAEEQLAEVQKQLKELGVEFQKLTIEQDKTISKIETVQTKIDSTQSQIDQKEAELEEQQEALSKRVSDSYKNGPLSTLNLLLASESFDELLSNSRYVDKINDADRSIIDDIQTIRIELEAQKDELESQMANLESLKVEQERQLESMRAKQAEIKTMLDNLSQDVKDLMAKRDAEYLAAVEEEERQRKAAEEANKNSGNIVVTGSSKSLQRVLSSCRATPSPGAGLCAMWVSQVFNNAGFSYPGGNANDQYNWWCTSSNRDKLKPGMIIAVSSHPHSSAGMVYGHVGIYVGSNTVMDNIGYVRSIDLDEWIAYYGGIITPRWGWVFGTELV